MNIFGRNSRVTIGGKTYIGNNISINNDEVYVDGELQDGSVLEERRKIEVVIHCNVERIISDESIHIKGNVLGNVEAGTSISCDSINGHASAGTSINCDDIYGDATAGTSINCDVIRGSATAKIINR